jgi:peptidoglycan/LPS O-acetylase OafA/YrhL
MFIAVPRFYPSEWLIVTFGHSVLALTFGSLLLVGLRDPAPKWLTGEALRTLGKYSYGTYVWHWPLQQVLLGWYTPSTAQPPSVGLLEPSIFLLTGVLGSMLLGLASYHLIEQPFLRLKRLFAYGKQRVPWTAKAATELPVSPTV